MAIGSLLYQYQSAEGIAGSTAFAKEMKARYNLSDYQVELLSAAAIAAVGGGKIKGGKDKPATTPTGEKGKPLIIPDGTNKPAVINGRDFSGHALDRMQRQGITPTTVQNAITPQNAVVGKRPGTTAYYDKTNNITVITDTKTGAVVTVDYGKIKQ